MTSIKDNYTQTTKKWLEGFLFNKYSKEYKIEVIIPLSDISKINNPSIKKINNYSLLDFHPDVLGILTSKINEGVNIILLNRSTSSISIKEIGEMNIYSQIINPIASFIVSLKGLPNEVNSLLLSDDICNSLLHYHNKEIVILKIDEKG